MDRAPQTIQGRVLDPAGPLRARLILPLLCVLTLLPGVLAVAGVMPGDFGWSFCASLFFLAAAQLFPWFPSWREARIDVSEGRVGIQQAGLLSREIRARRVKAVSTANSVRGVVVAVDASSTGRPLLIEVADAKQAGAICDALAIGTRGLGALRWPVRAGSSMQMRRGAAWVLGLVSVLAPATTLAGPLSGDLAGLFVVLMMMIVGSLMFMISGALGGQDGLRLTLTPQGIDLSKAYCGWEMIPYGCIEDVRLTDEGFELLLEAPHPRIVIPAGSSRGGVAVGELEHVADQIRSASLRARGLGKAERSLGEGVEGLRRGQESVREWLARLDMQASNLIGGGAYRGDGYSSAELWEALESHDTDGELRVAAARMLARVKPQEVGVRVASLAEMERDDDLRRGLELAVEEQDAEALAERLEGSHLWPSRR